MHLASALVLGSLLILLNNNETYYQKIDPASPVATVTVTEAKLFQQNGQLQTENVYNGKYKDVDTTTYHVWQNTEPTGGPGRQISGRRAGQAGLFRRSGHQRHYQKGR